MFQDHIYMTGPADFIVCIDGLEHGIARGTFYNRYLKEGCSFRDLSEFLQAADEVMDAGAFPQACFIRRGFIKTLPDHPKIEIAERRRRLKPYHAEDKLYLRHGKLGTFWVTVRYRQNGSWQGRAAWARQRSAYNQFDFRSALELILAMRDLLIAVETEENKCQR